MRLRKKIPKIRGEEEIGAEDHREGDQDQIYPNIMIISFFLSFLNCTDIIKIFMILYENYLRIVQIL